MSQNIEDIWQSCLKVNTNIGKHKNPHLICYTGLWAVEALSTYGGSTYGGSKPETITNGHSTILEAVEAFQQYLIDFINSSTKELDQELKNIEEAKGKNQILVSELLGH